MEGADFQLISLLFGFIVEVLLFDRDIVQIINYLFDFRCGESPGFLTLPLVLRRQVPTHWLFLEFPVVQQVVIGKVALRLSVHTGSSFLVQVLVQLVLLLTGPYPFLATQPVRTHVFVQWFLGIHPWSLTYLWPEAAFVLKAFSVSEWSFSLSILREGVVLLP